MAYIEFRNIIKNFGTVNVLKGISLDIEEGEFITLLGPSGCGNRASTDSCRQGDECG